MLGLAGLRTPSCRLDGDRKAQACHEGPDILDPDIEGLDSVDLAHEGLASEDPDSVGPDNEGPESGDLERVGPGYEGPGGEDLEDAGLGDAGPGDAIPGILPLYLALDLLDLWDLWDLLDPLDRCRARHDRAYRHGARVRDVHHNARIAQRKGRRPCLHQSHCSLVCGEVADLGREHGHVQEGPPVRDRSLSSS